jgi:hypothetical protein
VDGLVVGGETKVEDVEGVGVMVVVGAVGVVGVIDVRVCVNVFAVTVDGGGEVFDGAVEMPYTITASALRRVTVVVCAEREPSSFSTYPG